MLDYQKIRLVAQNLGIKLSFITVYKAELVYLKNDGLKLEQIAVLLDDKANNVGHWLTREACPNNRVIALLEKMHFERLSKTS